MRGDVGDCGCNRSLSVTVTWTIIEICIGAAVEGGGCTDEEGEVVESAGVEGGGAEDEEVPELGMEEDEEEEGTLGPDFDLAKVLAGPNDFKNVRVLYSTSINSGSLRNIVHLSSCLKVEVCRLLAYYRCWRFVIPS